MTTSTLDPVVDPRIDDGTTENIAHLIRKEDQLKAFVYGEAVTALCGKHWVPTVEPKGLPLCPACEKILGLLVK